MTTLASNKRDTVPALFIDVANFKVAKKVQTYQGALFCTEGQQNQFMCVQVQLLFPELPLHITIKQTTPHFQSPLSQSTQFTMSINNAASQRGEKWAGYIVGVYWLKYWVRFLAKARNKGNRGVHLNKLFITRIQMNRSPRTTSLDTTRPSTIFYRLLFNWASLRRH
jgi:hypothetical protein